MAPLRLSASASVTPTERGVLLRSDLGSFQLDGSDVQSFVQEVLPLLDGSRALEDIAVALPHYSRASVIGLLDTLHHHGLVEEVPEPGTQERWQGQEQFFRKWTEHASELSERLKQARVLVVGLEPWGGALVHELALAAVGELHLVDDGVVSSNDLLYVPAFGESALGQPRSTALAAALRPIAPWCRITAGQRMLDQSSGALDIPENRWDLVVAAGAMDDLPVLFGLTRFAHTHGIRSLYGHLEGLEAVLGPAVVPGETACWNCCRLRELGAAEHLEARRQEQASLLARRPSQRMHTYLAPMPALLGQLMALECVKLLAGYVPSSLIGRLMVQNLVTLESSMHTVIRMPWCEVCGGASAGGGVRGGHAVPLDRIDDPTRLRQELEGFVDTRTGIIRYLGISTPDATEPELPITSGAFLAAYTGANHSSDQAEIGSGKGLSVTEALISAVGEAIERYSAARYRESDLVRCSFDELSGDRLDPRRLCLYQNDQYAEPGFPFAPFDPARPIHWMRGEWLDTRQPVWLPALPVYFNFHAPPAERFCQVTSNGLAAGLSRDDAAQRAVFELVERDAFMLTWLCRRPGRRLVPDETLDGGAWEVVRQLEERRVSVELYLLDAGIRIPTVACLALGDGVTWPAVTVALAAHASPRTAARKAILEQGHVGPYIRRLMLDPQQVIPDRPEAVRTLTDHALFYAPTERVVALDFLRSGVDEVRLRELDEPASLSLSDTAARLNEAGLRVAIADVTSPDVALGPFRVMRALGIDIQPIDFGFQFRRLANGRLWQMLAGQLNPYPHPLA